MSIVHEKLVLELVEKVATLTARVTELENASGEAAMARLYDLESKMREFKSETTNKVRRMQEALKGVTM